MPSARASSALKAALAAALGRLADGRAACARVTRACLAGGAARVSDGAGHLAVPCRTDEPSLGRTLDTALASWRRAPQAARGGLEVLVCLNGAEAPGPRAALERFAAAAGAPLAPARRTPRARRRRRRRRARVARDGAPDAARREADRVERAPGGGARGRVALFMDADVGFAPETFGLLLDTLEAHPGAAIATARTTCAPRPGLFESIMAAPYGVEFPNISPQLYAGRLAALPATMPEDLLEPERWLELRVGRERVVRAPGAEVAVRLPGTLADFFRQRIRIEMGKVQFAHEYPGIETRGRPQPGRADGARAPRPRRRARGSPRTSRSASVAHALAWWRYRRGRHGGHLAAGRDDQALGPRVKVLFVTTRCPVPPWRGDQLRAYHHLRLLAPRHEITCCILAVAPAAGRGDGRGGGARRRASRSCRSAGRRGCRRSWRARWPATPAAPGAALRPPSGARAARARSSRERFDVVHAQLLRGARGPRARRPRRWSST